MVVVRKDGSDVGMRKEKEINGLRAEGARQQAGAQCALLDCRELYFPDRGRPATKGLDKLFDRPRLAYQVAAPALAKRVIENSKKLSIKSESSSMFPVFMKKECRT